MSTKFSKDVPIDVKDPVLVSISEYRGVERLDIRIWWEGRPTKKGISVELADAERLVDTIIEVLNHQRSEDPDFEGRGSLALVEFNEDRSQLMDENGMLYDTSVIP